MTIIANNSRGPGRPRNKGRPKGSKPDPRGQRTMPLTYRSRKKAFMAKQETYEQKRVEAYKQLQTRSMGQIEHHGVKAKKRKRTITVISRRDQIHWKIDVKLAKLDKKVKSGGRVSSSWIAGLEWNPDTKVTTMYLIDGWAYDYTIPFKMFEGWYYAYSKGTYWHEVLRGRYYNKYIKKYRY